jgi:hypothetical protein
MADSASAQEQTPRRWLPAALAAMVIYPAIGIGFAFLDSASVPAGVRFWRLAAWVVSALVFGAHLVHELRRPTTNPLQTASHVSIGVALGAFVLAVWVLAHGHMTSRPQSPLAPLALVLFPLVTALPALVVAFVTAGLVGKMRRTR